MGQIERLPRPALSARYVIGQEPLARACGNGRDAPKTAICPVASKPPGSNRSGHSVSAHASAAIQTRSGRQALRQRTNNHRVALE
jgi:hypothetical protein